MSTTSSFRGGAAEAIIGKYPRGTGSGIPDADPRKGMYPVFVDLINCGRVSVYQPSEAARAFYQTWLLQFRWYQRHFLGNRDQTKGWRCSCLPRRT
jgi:hypothetical protein